MSDHVKFLDGLVFEIPHKHALGLMRAGDEIQRLEAENAALKVERDELAARAAIISEAAENAVGILCGHNIQAGNTPLELMAAKVMREQKSRDARMKAEALEELRDAPVWGSVEGAWQATKGVAAEYRKQAEEK